MFCNSVIKPSKLSAAAIDQAIKKISPHLLPMAYAEDQIIEGVYAPDKKFVWGVQWHPEFSFQKDENSRKILWAFVKACLSEKVC